MNGDFCLSYYLMMMMIMGGNSHGGDSTNIDGVFSCVYE